MFFLSWWHRVKPLILSKGHSFGYMLGRNAVQDYSTLKTIQFLFPPSQKEPNYRRNSLTHTRVNKCTSNYARGRVWRARSLGEKSLNYLGMHTEEVKPAYPGISRTMGQRGKGGNSHPRTWSHALPCIRSWIREALSTQQNFFLCLFTSGCLNSNLLLRQGEGKMQASIPIPVHDLNLKCTQKNLISTRTYHNEDIYSRRTLS